MSKSISPREYFKAVYPDAPEWMANCFSKKVLEITPRVKPYKLKEHKLYGVKGSGLIMDDIREK